MTPTSGDGAPAAALTGLCLLGLLAVAERAGLPGAYIQGFLAVAAALTVIGVIAASSTARERLFMGSDAAASPVASGLALAAAIWMFAGALGEPEPGTPWLAALAGAPVGVVLAHLVERISRNARADGDEVRDALVAWPRALMIAAIGAAATFAMLPVAAREAARVFGLDPRAAMLLVAGAALAPSLLGGARSVLAFGSAAAVAAAAILVGLLLAGLLLLGPLPLPGQSDIATLQAVAEARARWGLPPPPYPLVWPAAAAFLDPEPLRAFGASLAVAAAVSLAVPPAVRTHRRSVAATAAAALTALPILTAAIAGYAVEAAATRFVGAPAARPPAALVEASALGLVKVCGASSGSGDVLRAACGVSPRDPMRLDWGQIAISNAYLDSGLAAALNLPSTASISAGGGRLALALAAASLGLWMAARALGRDILGRRRDAAGYASLRLGLVRLAAAGLAAVGVVGAETSAALPIWTPWALGGAALALAAIALRRAFRTAPTPPADPQPIVERRPRRAPAPRGAS